MEPLIVPKFGITNIMHIAIAHMIYNCATIFKFNIIKKMYLSKYVWLVRGTVINEEGFLISLEYPFRMPNKEAAQRVLKQFSRFLKEDGMKTWLSFWIETNGKADYLCTLSKLMGHTANIRRIAKFNSKEKSKFWEETELLSKINLKIVSPFRKRKGEKKKTSYWIQAPLITVVGKIGRVGAKYPSSICGEVLSEDIIKKFKT